MNRTPKGQQSSKLSPASVCSRLQVAYILKMFVPKAGGRNTRRRQRTSSDDSVNPPKAKRQRSVLRRPDESPSDTNLGRELAKLATPTAPNGDTITPTDQMNDLHISTRVVKQGDGSGINNEGSIVLVGYMNIFARSFRPSSPKC